MSQYSEPYAPTTGEPAAEPSTTDVARDQATQVGQHARQAGGQVAQTATDQAQHVVAEASQQVRDLLGEAQGQARDQVSAQQQKAAGQLHSFADELGQMAGNSGQSGVAVEVARQASDRLHGAASWLEQREPADLVDEVRSFARRRPGTFLIGAAVAGLAVGRLTRGLVANRNDQQDAGSDAATPAPAATPAVPYGTTPVYPAEPAYEAVTVYGTEPAYPAEPAYGAGSGTVPSYEGPR